MHTTSGHSSDIDPQFLLNAYCKGFFPMAESREGEIGWFSPDPRGIIELDEFKVSRSLRQRIKQNLYEIRLDKHFENVVRSCGRRNETWISESIVRSYVRLFELGFAHSVETWMGEELVGGLYGVAVKGAFFGESMFSTMRDASKVALAYLVARLKERGFVLLDTQYSTPHLARLGAKEISRDEYLERLERALRLQCTFIER